MNITRFFYRGEELHIEYTIERDEFNSGGYTYISTETFSMSMTDTSNLLSFLKKNHIEQLNAIKSERIIKAIKEKEDLQERIKQIDKLFEESTNG